MSHKKTNFGFSTVEIEQKQQLVQKVFYDVSPYYDLMNDIMSLGLHRIWKTKFIRELNPYKNDVVLDLAGGTGDIARKFLEYGGKAAVVCDLNYNMLKQGYYKAIDQNVQNANISWLCANIELLPFLDNQFDYCTIAFGIRNVTNMQMALKEAYRVLKPGGRFLCMEFSQIDNAALQKFYKFYAFNVIPQIGKIVANSDKHYRYLAESIAMFPKPQEFMNLIENVGFKLTRFYKLTFGVVVIYSGYKF